MRTSTSNSGLSAAIDTPADTGESVAERLVHRLNVLANFELQVDDSEAALQGATAAAPAVLAQLLTTLDDLALLAGGLRRPDPVEAANADLEEIGALIAREASALHIENVAAATAFPLRYSVAGLESALQRGEPVRILSETDAALSRLRRALAELCPLLAAHFDLPCSPPEPKDLEVHVQTRRAYGVLRRELSDPGLPVDPQAVSERIHRAGELLSHLLHRSGSVEMRIDDRVAMRRLLERIREWESSSAGNEADGTHLVEDIAGFVRLINGINNRQELIEHDRRIAVEALNRLQRSSLDRPPDPELLRRLSALEGRDRAIDALLLRTPPAPARDWLLPLHRLTTTLVASCRS